MSSVGSGFAQTPLPAQTANLVTFQAGGTAYYPQTITAGLATTTAPYTQTGTIINCTTFSNLTNVYLAINNSSPSPITMGAQWLLEDLNKVIEFQVNGEAVQRLRLVKRNNGPVSNNSTINVPTQYQTFYVPVWVAFDAVSPSTIWDTVYVARTG